MLDTQVLRLESPQHTNHDNQHPSNAEHIIQDHFAQLLSPYDTSIIGELKRVNVGNYNLSHRRNHLFCAYFQLFSIMV